MVSSTLLPSQSLTLRLHHHFPQTRLAGSCTVFGKWLTQTKDERHPLRRKEGYVCNFPLHIIRVRTSSTGGLLTPLLTNPLILHLHHHFLQTRLAGSCAAVLQAHTVFRK